MVDFTSQRTRWWQGDGEPLTEEQSQHLRADLRLRLLTAAGGMVLAIVVFFALVVFNSHQHPDNPIRWPLVIGLSAGMVVVTALGAVVGLWARSRNRSLRSYVASGDRKARMRVAKQLRKGRTVADEDRGVAQATVDMSRRQWWFPLLLIGSAAVYGIAVLIDLHSNPPRPAPLQAMRLLLPFVTLALAGYYFLVRRRLLANAARQGITPAADSSTTGRG